MLIIHIYWLNSTILSICVTPIQMSNNLFERFTHERFYVVPVVEPGL